MFNNIGGKIKGLAEVFAWIGIIASVIYGGSFFSHDDDELIAIGIVIIVAGSLVSWISSLTLYGFGELIDKMSSVETLMKNISGVKENEMEKVISGAEKNGTAKGPALIVNEQSGEVGECRMCGESGVPVWQAKIVDEMGTRFGYVCHRCIEKNNCEVSKK